ncbi:hypothetical protein [Streptomyces scopuliridis]|uniref:Uncharacterized protein n=1 Tax=Streptomyces scopuliridis TaxID=452529 RepID=A0ACD4ZYJ5_9ACTN|nr:hypothetical protein [Streptomyces scopuliridis]WSC03593.1 hypothetical protein OG835_42635 [Streptomyces scopuliridis]
MRTLIARPVVLALAWSTEVVLLVAMLAVGLPATAVLQSAGLAFNTAVAVSLPLMFTGGFTAAVWWSGRRSSGRRPLAHVCSQAADAVADWAGWPDPRTAEERGQIPRT